MKLISRTFITGLITLLPALLTLYMLYWLVVSTETLLGKVIRQVLPAEMYWPGMGVAVGLVVVFLVGLLMHAYVVRWLFSKGEQLFYHVPLVNTVYRAIRDFFGFISPAKKKEFEQVVAVDIGNTGMRVIGFVTQADPKKLPAALQGQDNVLVYLPLSYMIGGYTLLLPRSAVEPLDMKMEEAMRFTLTAGVTATGISRDRD